MKPALTKEVTMPTGKVKFYDEVKGFGFIASDEGNEVFLHVSALPDGVTAIKPGSRVEFSVVDGKKGAQVLSLRVIEVPASLESQQKARTRKPAADMVILVEGLITLLEGIKPGLEHGRLPEGEHGAKIARLLRSAANELD